MNLKYFLIAGFFILLANTAMLSSSIYPPSVGNLHPDFVLPRIDNGKPVSISQFRGTKLLLINFAAW